MIAMQAGGPELAQPEKKSGKFTLKSDGKGQYKVAPGEQIKVPLTPPPTPLTWPLTVLPLRRYVR